MARYERDYGRDHGRWRQQSPPSGGMRSDAWGGAGDWRQFPGEEGWYGEGYEGMPGFGYDVGIRGEGRAGRWGGWGLGDRYGGGEFQRGGFQGRGFQQGGFQDRGYQGGELQDRGYQGGFQDQGSEYRGRGMGYGGRGWESGHPGRNVGYSEGWEDSWRRERDRTPSRGGRGERGTTRAAELMTENPETVTPDATLADVAQKMRDLDVGIIPVVDNAESRRLRGVITDRDIAIRAIAEGKDGKARVSDCMTPNVRSVNKNDSVHDVMRTMRQEQVRRVPVTDREGRLVGIIAQADLAVDWGGDDQQRELEVEETVERISRPAEPQGRGRHEMAASDTGASATSEPGGRSAGKSRSAQKQSREGQ